MKKIIIKILTCLLSCAMFFSATPISANETDVLSTLQTTDKAYVYDTLIGELNTKIVDLEIVYDGAW